MYVMEPVLLYGVHLWWKCVNANAMSFLTLSSLTFFLLKQGAHRYTQSRPTADHGNVLILEKHTLVGWSLRSLCYLLPVDQETVEVSVINGEFFVVVHISAYVISKIYCKDTITVLGRKNPTYLEIIFREILHSTSNLLLTNGTPEGSSFGP